MSHSVTHDIITALRDDIVMSHSVIHDMIIALRDDICLTVSYTI